MEPDVDAALGAHAELSKIHDMIVVEGMGGIMVPIRADYYVADLVADMRASALIVCPRRVGTVNHAVMTVNACTARRIDVVGIIINDTGVGGYDTRVLARDLESLTHTRVIGSLNHLDDTSPQAVCNALESSIDVDALVA